MTMLHANEYKITKELVIKLLQAQVEHITTMWNSFLNLPVWNKNPVWAHGDLLPGNSFNKS